MTMATLKITSICHPPRPSQVTDMSGQMRVRQPVTIGKQDTPDQISGASHEQTACSVVTSVRTPLLIDHAVFAAGSYQRRSSAQQWTGNLVEFGYGLRNLLDGHGRRTLPADLDGWKGSSWIDRDYVKLKLEKTGIAFIKLTFSPRNARFHIDTHPECLQASPDHSTIGGALRAVKGELNLLLNALLRTTPILVDTAKGPVIKVGSIVDDQRPRNDLVSTLSVLSVSSPIDAHIKAVPRSVINNLNSGAWSDHTPEFLRQSRDEGLRAYLAAHTRLLDVLGFRFVNGLGSSARASFDAETLRTKIGRWPPRNSSKKARPYERKAQLYNKSMHVESSPERDKNMWWKEYHARLRWTRAGYEVIRLDAETGQPWLQARGCHQLHQLDQMAPVQVALGVLGHLRSNLPRSWKGLHKLLFGSDMAVGRDTPQQLRIRKSQIAVQLVELHQIAMTLFNCFAKSVGVHTQHDVPHIATKLHEWRECEHAPTLQQLFGLIEEVEREFRGSIKSFLIGNSCDEDFFSVGKSLSGADAEKLRMKAMRGDSVTLKNTREHTMRDERRRKTTENNVGQEGRQGHAPSKLKLVPSVVRNVHKEGQHMTTVDAVTNSDGDNFMTPGEVRDMLHISSYMLKQLNRDGLLVPCICIKLSRNRILERYRRKNVIDLIRGMDRL